MDEDDQIRIKANYKQLVKQLKAEDVLDHLFQEGVLHDEDLQEVQAGTTEQSKVRTLLKILPKKGKKKGISAFKIFCDAMEEADFGHLVKMLKDTDPASFIDPTDVRDSAAESVVSMDKMELLKEQLWLQTHMIMEAKQEIDRLKQNLASNAKENEKVMQRFEDLEDQIRVKGLTQEHVLEYLKDYVNQPGVDIPDKSPSHKQPSKPPVATVNQATPFEYVGLIAHILGKDIVRFMTKTDPKIAPPNNHAATLRRVVTEMTEKHNKLFSELTMKLKVTNMNGYETIGNVSDEVFLDGRINWGKIVALYAFGCWVARRCVEQSMSDFAETIGDFVGHYVAKNLGHWIVDQGGWAAFDDQFPEQGDTEDTRWKAMLLGAVGLGALVTIVSTRF